MKNIEIKVKVNSFDNIIKSLEELGASYKGRIKQVDTYYNCQSGRLKIREINNKQAELIYYQRPNKKSSKISQYGLIRLDTKMLPNYKNIFKKSLGEKVIVKKIRKLWIYQNTRIHLDRVQGLGNFIELETVINGHDYRKLQRKHQKIIEALQLMRFKVQSKSYSDLILG